MLVFLIDLYHFQIHDFHCKSQDLEKEMDDF